MGMLSKNCRNKSKIQNVVSQSTIYSIVPMTTLNSWSKPEVGDEAEDGKKLDCHHQVKEA